MKARSWMLLAAMSVAGCSSDRIGPEPAEFAELCGEVGPVQILALDGDRPLVRATSAGMLDGRRIVVAAYLGDEEPEFSDLPPIGEQEVWSVGPCGEDPLLLASGEQQAAYFREQDNIDGWPALLLVCDQSTGQISTVDPTGVRASNVVFESSDCMPRTIDEGMLTLVPNDEASASLVLQRWPEDPWTMKAEPTVLHDSIRMPTDLHYGRDWGFADAEILLISTADELVSVSQLDGELTTVATDVHSFDNDSSGRYIVWQGTELTNGDPDSPEGPIWFLDRETNEVTQLTEGSLSQMGSNRFILAQLGIMQMWIEAEQVMRFYRLPTLESIDVPTRLFVFGAFDDTRALVSDYWPFGPHWLLDTVTGELTPVVDEDADIVKWEEDSVVVLEAAKLWRVPFDGGEAELLARRATRQVVFTADGRVLTLVEVGADWAGSLIVVDPSTLEEGLIDRDVVGWGLVTDDPVILYGVADPERQGVWLARLAD